MSEQRAIVEKTVVVHVDIVHQNDHEEFTLLAEATGAEIVAHIVSKIRRPDAKFFVGKGKAEEIQQYVAAHKATLVLVDQDLTPAQERNLERLIQCRVLDRTGLILDIFASRARSFEGKLQVELAQLEHLVTRLVRGWTHLERQKGGIGLRGPGETQLETDRRLVRNRINAIKKRLAKVRSQREQARRARKRALVPTVALIGYTNAGKSTLFNRLSRSDVFVADQLFATLDPTMRRLELPDISPLVLVDTVGFIRDLPHDLVNAFHATLEETADADLLLHVIDGVSPHRRETKQEVHEVLTQIEANTIPTIEIYNKIDNQAHPKAKLLTDEQGNIRRIYLSALTGEGIDLLLEAIAQYFTDRLVTKHIELKPNEGKLRAKLYELGNVLSEETSPEGDHIITVRLKRVDYQRLFN